MMESMVPTCSEQTASTKRSTAITNYSVTDLDNSSVNCTVDLHFVGPGASSTYLDLVKLSH
jgi:hypothetical protein